jgi:hypothetical protein
VTHREIEEREIVEAYLQGKLPDNDAQAFEEHFFACDQCFAEVRAAGNFIAGVRQIAQAGSPRDTGESGRLPEARRWQPAFGFAWAAAALLIVTTAWFAFFELPRGRRELARQRGVIEEERGRRQELERQLALVRPPTAEGNLPFAMLEASRAGQPNEVTLPPGATRLVLWIELGPGVRFSSYRLQIRDQAGATVETIDGLTKNVQGALTASVPGARLPADTYTVLVHGAGGGRDALVGEYRLVVRR